MTETIEPMDLGEDEKQALAHRLVDQAREQEVDLVGPGGLLTGLTKQVLETALEEELTDHLDYDHSDRAAKTSANERNGTRPKTVLTEIGPVEIEVPRDRDGSFEPAIVKKRQRRLDGVDQLVLSLTARGLTTGEISANFMEVLTRPVRPMPDGAHILRNTATTIDAYSSIGSSTALEAGHRADHLPPTSWRSTYCRMPPLR